MFRRRIETLWDAQRFMASFLMRTFMDKVIKYAYVLLVLYLVLLDSRHLQVKAAQSLNGDAGRQDLRDSKLDNAPDVRGDQTLGERDAITVLVTSPAGKSLCNSFAFSQIPDASDLFVSKLKTSTEQGICSGSLTLALFRMDWSRHAMLLLHTILEVPVAIGTQTISAAYDPYVAKFDNEIWVAFECVGPHIPGTSACVAPLVKKEGEIDHIDLTRLSIPVVGLDGDPKSPWTYSASTPKLLSFKGHLYLYWTAIQSEKAPPHRWKHIETRGAEIEVDHTDAGRMWAKGRSGRSTPSRAPGTNMRVMAPNSRGSHSNISVDTEGFFTVGDSIVVLSSVGGDGPDHAAPCTKPLDKSPGCFRLVITRTIDPLAENSLQQNTLIFPKLPANPVEYPRVVIAPDHRTYLLAESHLVQIQSNTLARKAIATGLVLIPFPIESLKFGGPPASDE
jgi:hypothetical protein